MHPEKREAIIERSQVDRRIAIQSAEIIIIALIAEVKKQLVPVKTEAVLNIEAAQILAQPGIGEREIFIADGTVADIDRMTPLVELGIQEPGDGAAGPGIERDSTVINDQNISQICWIYGKFRAIVKHLLDVFCRCRPVGYVPRKQAQRGSSGETSLPLRIASLMSGPRTRLSLG